MTYKNILQKGAFATLLAGALVVTVSCNDDDVSPVLEERVLVKEINLEVTPELPLLIDTDTLIKYTVGPDEAFNKEVVWKSTVPDVATVDAEGRITAVKAGNTVISAKPVVGYSATSTINVKVVTKSFTSLISVLLMKSLKCLLPRLCRSFGRLLRSFPLTPE